MLSSDLHLAYVIMDQRVREAQSYRLLRQPGVEHLGWAARQARGLLHPIAHLLVCLGQRLHPYTPPQCLVADRPVTGLPLGGAE